METAKQAVKRLRSDMRDAMYRRSPACVHVAQMELVERFGQVVGRKISYSITPCLRTCLPVRSWELSKLIWKNERRLIQEETRKKRRLIHEEFHNKWGF